MKRLVLAFVLFASPALAQSSLLGDPSNPQPGTLIYERAKFPAVLTRAQTVELLNAVAWANRASGWGMLSKGGDNSCSNGRISISCDTLIHYPSTMHFDVLIDGEATAKPDWRPNGPCFLGPSSGCELSKFVAPYDPGGANVPPPPVQPPVVVPPYQPPPVYTDLGPIYQRLDSLSAQAERMFSDLTARDAARAAQIAAVDQRLEKHDNEPGWLKKVMTNSNTYVAVLGVLGGFLANGAAK